MTETHLARVGPAYQHHQFDDLDQQHRAQSLGMWFFLSTEAMMFGGLFLAYTLYRWLYPEAFISGSHRLNLLMGSINTFVLILSSLTIALAGSAAKRGRRGALLALLAVTAVLGLVFLGIKGFEWTEDYHRGLVPVFHWTHFRDHPRDVAALARHGAR